MMETVTDRINSAEPRSGHAATEVESVRPSMAFLAENPESFGLIPDACPLATKHLLIGANGRSAENGEYAPVYEMESVGIDGLFSLYGDILPHTVETVDALEAAFGDSRLLQAHPVARYCATLAELTALQIMNNGAYGASPEQTRLLLNRAVERNLSELRDRMRSRSGDFGCDDSYFSVSMGVCRVLAEGAGSYVADIFSAGNFHVYILDGNGMTPLWQTATPEVSPGRADSFRAERIRFRREGPFAVLLVSDSVCALNAAETRSLRSYPDRIWKYRLRLESSFVRLITDCVREHEFGERATRYFVGRSHGHDSASGAMTILRGGSSYNDFLALCQNRLSELQRLSELFSNEENLDETTLSGSRTEAELAYLDKLLRENATLSARLTEALQRCVLHKLQEDEDPPTPPDAPDYVRLSREEVYRAFRVYDCENDEDRARIRTNRRALREYMSEHWITMRPALISGSAGGDGEGESHRVTGDRMYGACLQMNGELTRMLLERSRQVLSVETLLANSLERITAEGNDWIYGRAGGDFAAHWAESLAKELPEVLEALRTDWKQNTESYRALLSAYSAEREALFRHDTRPGLGGFAEDWQRILEGTLPESRWDLFCGRLSDDPETAGFTDMMESLHRISRGTGALLARIRARSAESRAARDLADQPELRLAALRGAAYEDEDWGKEITAVMDTATRNDFRATVRRWQEARRLAEDRRRAYRRYRSMYTEFIDV